MSQAEWLLSYSILSLISCKVLSSAQVISINGEEDKTNNRAKHLVNNNNAWWWREGCDSEGMIYFTYYVHWHNIIQDWLKLTKEMQKASEMQQSVVDLFDVGNSQFRQSEPNLPCMSCLRDSHILIPYMRWITYVSGLCSLTTCYIS